MNISEIQISVIVPYYNVPIQYLKNMLNSIMKSRTKTEIIIVNDGSDKIHTKQLLDIASKYESLTVIWQNHKGVSAARNLGIKCSNGEFVTFADADDILEEHFLETALAEARECDFDVVYGNIKYCTEHEKYNKATISGDFQRFYENDIDEVKKSLLGSSNGKIPFVIQGTACARLIKRRLLDKVHFNENVDFFEDQLFNRELIEEAKKVSVTEDICYYYIQREQSAMHMNRGVIEFDLQIKPYWDELYIINAKEKGELRQLTQKSVLNEYIRFMHLTVVDANELIIRCKAKMSNAAHHSLVVEAIDYLDDKKDILNVREKITFYCIKNGIFIPFLILVRLNYYFKIKKEGMSYNN